MINIAFKENYVLGLPETHPFPMKKYDLLPAQLKHEGIVEESSFFVPRPVTEEELLSVHTKDYWHNLRNLLLTPREEKKTGFPQSEEMVDRELDITGGTLELAEKALSGPCGFNIAGGTHHAFSDHGEGYCLLNDNAIAAQVLLNKKLVKKVLIVDLDVHQGNGTAKIFSGNDAVYTFSMHGQKNYPADKMKSDLDIALPSLTGDDEYLPLLEETMDKLLDEEKPDFIFYQAGVDVLEGDKFGRLALSMEGCRERDYIVISRCHKYSIPLVVTMGGGYSKSIARITNAHANTYRVAADLYGLL